MASDLAPSGPQPINIWLESLISRQSLDASADSELAAQKDDAILLLLGKLALVYWRPDFTPKQAEQLYAQFLDDLRDLPFESIVGAIEAYRRNPENKFYPTPGQLRGLIINPPGWWVGSRNEWVKEVREDAKKELVKLEGKLPVFAIEKNN